MRRSHATPSEESPRIARLTRLLEVARGMAATTDLDVLLTVIVGAAMDVLECERATIFLYDSERDELYSRVAAGAGEIRFPATVGVAGAVAQTRKVLNIPDAYADARFNRDVDRKTGFRTRNLLTVPLENLNGELMGVLQGLNKTTGPFADEDEEMAAVLGAQAGVALHRARLLEEYAVKQRLARDLDIARTIQRAYLPESNPTIDGYDVAGWNRSADETGGDCFDFIALPDGRWAVMLADATGHGIGAALIVVQFRAALRALLTTTHDVAEVAARVNDLLSDDITEGRFVTAFLGVFDPAAHRIEYVSAGQAPLLLIGTDGVASRDATGFPLAIMPGAEFGVESWDLTPGSTFLLLTDGFYEAADPEGELLGDARVAEFVRARPDLPAKELIGALLAEVERFSAGAPQADDLTAVVIRRRA